MKKYLYSGPISGATIKTNENKSIEVVFHDGKTYELPSDNAYVKTLIARGHLTQVDDKSVIKGQEAKITKNTDKPEGNK